VSVSSFVLTLDCAFLWKMNFRISIAENVQRVDLAHIGTALRQCIGIKDCSDGRKS
jgi:hypothetical protein